MSTDKTGMKKEKENTRKEKEDKGTEPPRNVGATDAVPDDTSTGERTGAAASEETSSSAEAGGESPDAVESESIASLQREIDTLKNQLLRRAAEFENYRKRTEENNRVLVNFANESLITELLSVIDDFDRSMKAGKEHPDLETFYTGVDLIRGKLVRILESRGLKRLECVGQPFDVAYHDALLQLPRDDVAPHTIIDEIEPGYMLNEKVIRHAKVVVASESTGGAAEGDTRTATEENAGADGDEE